MARIFYFFGQSAKISLKFTDKEPIFIDLSVNGSDFAKGSAAHHRLNHCT
ncbi:MAG TPA: prevent-host-death protein [Lactobacillus sp.]|nr:prevent-host-death protein [Ligilactobacillus ruminis]HCI90636.1 prevent-host-death protein [Lactobacillus sp.]